MSCGHMFVERHTGGCAACLNETLKSLEVIVDKLHERLARLTELLNSVQP